jgi:Tfp pilus assembly protein FimV
MAACTTAPGIGMVSWPATSRRAPRAAIARGTRVTPATYRRRRLFVGLLALGVVVVAARAGVALGGSPLAAPERRPASSSIAAGAAGGTGSVVVVEPGDTLWSIATRLAPDDDPRPLVDQLSDQRAGAPLQPGERILLPD